jgi:hypothetical protein
MIKRIPVLLIVTLILTAGLLTFSAEAQTSRPSRTKQVRVYFPKEGDSADPQNNPGNLQPVMRSVNAIAPLRPAIEALLAGPTSAEEREGFTALDVNGLSIVKVVVRQGTAYASFAHRRGMGWAGDLSPLYFGDAVERTLKQFPTVRRTVVCVDGVVNFGDESGGPVKKCPKF